MNESILSVVLTVINNSKPSSQSYVVFLHPSSFHSRGIRKLEWKNKHGKRKEKRRKGTNTLRTSKYVLHESIRREQKKKKKAQSPAMFSFSPIGSRSSNDMKICVCVCARARACVWGRNELEVCSTLAYPHKSSFRTVPVLYTNTHTRILKPFQDIELTGLKVWILPSHLGRWRPGEGPHAWGLQTTDGHPWL